jgi:uncharacterized protein YecT (DUF1311 family)
MRAMRSWDHGGGVRTPCLVPLAFAALVVAAPPAARADEPDEDFKPAPCQRARDVTFPMGDQPDAAAVGSLEGCKSEALFYGIGQPADPAKARLCAYVERSVGDQVVFGGSAILMTIYASGVGAARNLDLAIRMACAIGGAPAEVDGRVAHLEELKAARSKGKAAFSLCDDVTSGFMQGHCAGHAYRIWEAKREQRLAALVASWSPEERGGWESLRAATSAFFKARSANEVDLGGTARAAEQIDEEETQEKGFDELLRKLGKDALPRATPAAFLRADAALNSRYKAIMAAPPQGDSGAVTKDGVRIAERAWLKYRDAWVAFTTLKFPNVDPLATKTWLTSERAAMLAEFVPKEPATKAQPRHDELAPKPP